VTKNFTATAIMRLHERKQLDLDRPVNDYLGAARVTSPKWGPDRIV
jgi:CubicO group peptidase (beta-lactamase class C family)